MSLCNVDWDIVVRFTEALAWPFVTILGILLLKPLVRSIADAFARNGGKFSVAGFDAELNANRVEEAAQAIIKNAPDQKADPKLEKLRVALREMSADELYYEVTGAWKEVSTAINLAYQTKTGGTLDWRSGHNSIAKAKKAGLLNGAQADAVDDLFAVRSSAKRRGPEDFRGMEMDADDVFTYIQATKALAQQISGK
jgi:hypothetical protein